MCCPTCYKKKFKISDMPTQNFKKGELKLTDTAQKLKTVNNEMEARIYNERLEQENTKLRNEILELSKKNERLLESLKRSEQKQDEEIRKLKEENEDLKKQLYIKQRLIEEFKSLESEIKILKLNIDLVKTQNKETHKKCGKYKTKFKIATKRIAELNQEMAKYRDRSTESKETWTNWATTCTNKIVLGSNQSGDSRYIEDVNTENLLLADIFFKRKPHLGSEIDFFSAKVKTKCAKDTLQ